MNPRLPKEKWQACGSSEYSVIFEKVSVQPWMSRISVSTAAVRADSLCRYIDISILSTRKSRALGTRLKKKNSNAIPLDSSRL